MKFLSIFVLFEFSVAFTSRSISSRRFKAASIKMDDSTPPMDLSTVVISGLISKEKKFAESFMFSRLFSSQNWDSITAVTDDLAFARKRMVNPKTVYSGLIDVLKFAEASSTDALQAVLATNDAWVCYNLPSKDLELYASVAAKAGLKRAVFAVVVSPEEAGADVTFDSATALLSAAGVQYTIVKYAGVTEIGESKTPYRISPAVSALPKDGEAPFISFQDLMVVLTESLDIPKTFNNVYGIGPGSKFDAEILVYMKSQGWPERVQVGILMGDLMEKIEAKYLEELKKEPTEKKESVLASTSSFMDGISYAGNKLAGFQ